MPALNSRLAHLDKEYLMDDGSVMELRTNRIFEALNKSVLMFGAEREMMLGLIMIVTLLVISAFTLVTVCLGASLWIIASFGLRKMAQNDPQMSKVFLRYWRKFRGPVFKSASTVFSRGFIAER